MRRQFVVVAAAAALAAGVIAAQSAPSQKLLVVCSPGSPGTTADAQPRMDAFAAALSARSGQSIAAVYEPSASDGAKRIESAGFAIVSLPFFLAYEKPLGLHARLLAVQKGRPALERWALVARKGRIRGADSLAGFTIAANSAYAPRFVAAAVREQLGALPGDVKLQQSTQVVSALRRAANGEQIAVLLDGAQADALSSLPIASQLEVVARSPAWPAGLVVTVDARVPARDWTTVQSALLGLASDATGAAALEALQMTGFAESDPRALASARNAYASAR